ncbi:MAG: hypothetical protein ACHREM_21620 [Polyangiales bacterium]
MQSTPEEQTATFIAWLENSAKKCTYLELRATMAIDSRVDNWPFEGHEPSELAETIAMTAAADVGDAVTQKYYVFAFKREGDPRHESRFILRVGNEKPRADDAKALVQASTESAKVAWNEVHKAYTLVHDNAKAMVEASKGGMQALTDRVNEHERNATQMWQTMHEINTIDRDSKALELEGKKELERTKVGGEALLMLIPAIVNKIAPGFLGTMKTSGDLAVVALFRTVTDEQRRQVAENCELRLTTAQIVGATALYNEVEKSKNGDALKAPLMHQLAEWLESLNDQQRALLMQGGVKLTPEQASGFLEIYVKAGETSESRERAVS